MADNQHNDPLEEFFKKKTQEYDIQYNEEDWRKLEKRLDAADKTLYNQKMRYAAAAAVIFLFSILAYVTYQQQVKINELNERLTNTPQIELPQQVFTDVLPENLFEFTPPENYQQLSMPDGENEDTDSQQDILADTERTSPEESENNTESQNQESVTSWNKAEMIDEAVLTERDLLAANNAFTAISGNDISAPVFDSSEESGYTPGNMVTNRDDEFPSPNAQRSVSSGQASRLTLGMLAGPDLSTVGDLSNFYNPGYKIGLAVEYAITENLAVSVGAVHSKVQYSASGSKYTPPQNYWSYGIIPDETVGVCFLIDIPVNLKYNFLHFKHSRLFATAGASSYIMLNEEYQFEYDSYTSGQPQQWQENTGTRHWMSNATFSLGYEMDLNQKLSLRAEPFIKVPIQEVGWGNVKLYSMGSLISVNYNL